MENDNVTFSAEENELVMRHFVEQILIITGTIPVSPPSQPPIKRKWRVGATAVVYFRRFFEDNSIINFDPRLIMLCSLFLAGKTEEHFVNLRELRNRVYSRYSEEHILACEVLLLESLHFDLAVEHPQNQANSLMGDMKRRFMEHLGKRGGRGERGGGGGGGGEVRGGGAAAVVEAEAIQPAQLELATGLNEWMGRTSTIILALQMTDATIRHKSFFVALAAFKLAGPPSQLPTSFEAYLQHRFGVDEVAGFFLSTEFELLRSKAAGADPTGMSDEQEEKLVLCIQKLKTANQWHKQVLQVSSASTQDAAGTASSSVGESKDLSSASTGAAMEVGQ